MKGDIASFRKLVSHLACFTFSRSFLLTTVILLHIGLPTITCKDISLKTESVIDELLKKNTEYDRKFETMTADLKATESYLGKL